MAEVSDPGSQADSPIPCKDSRDPSLTTTSTWDAQTFNNPSFGGAASGATLIGGADTVYNGTAVLNESYTPDAWGNLQQSGNFSFIQAFGNSNQVSTGGYGYDLAGNLTSDGLGNSYSYDGEGKLTASSGVNYVYDASGQRVEKVAGSNATEYIYFNGQPVALLNPSTGAWTDLIIAGGVPLAEVAGSQAASPMYRLMDHLGSLVVETDNSGNPIGSNLYAPYGQMMASSTSDPFAFTGLEQDTENGSYHATMRNYSLAPGRWLSPDPYDGSYDLMNPQSLNRYAYVDGNPLAYTDPSGLMTRGGGGADAGACAANPKVCDGVVVGGALLLWKVFDSIFGGGPAFHGSLSPRPTTGSPTWDGNFGESLGIPVNGPPFSMGGVTGALGLPSAGCEFGACGGVIFNATTGEWEIDKRPISGLGVLGDAALLFHYYFYNTKTHQSVGLGPGRGTGLFCSVPGKYEAPEKQGTLFETIPTSMQSCVNKTLQNDLKKKPSDYFFWDPYGSSNGTNCMGYVMSVIQRCAP